MNTVNFSEFVIRDNDRNDLFDPRIDEVRDLKDKPFSAKVGAQKLQGVLKQVHARTWKNLWLSKASDYLRDFGWAEYFGEQGEVELAAQALHESQEAAQSLPVRFDRKRADRVLAKAFELGSARKLREAQDLANAGDDIDQVKDHLNLARWYLQQARLITKVNKNFDESKAHAILRIAYQNGIPNLYKIAQMQAVFGNVSYTVEILDSIRIFIGEANGPPFSLALVFESNRVFPIMTQAYQNGVRRDWRYARFLAQAGRVKDLMESLRILRYLIDAANQAPYRLNLRYDAAAADALLMCAHRLKACPSN